MRFIIPVESIVSNRGGLIVYDPNRNKIIEQYVHNKDWKRIGWRGGAIYGDTFIATDWNDLHYFNISKWKYIKTFSKDSFNDLHYLKIYKNKLYVVNTGIDAIEIFNNPLNPQHKSTIFVFEKNKKIFTQRKLDMSLKYNQMMKVKPHACHVNAISFSNKMSFATCFYKDHKGGTGEVIELNSGRRIFQKNYDCHDSNFYNNDFYVTRTKNDVILRFDNLIKRKKEWPLNPSKVYRLGQGGWWRGMIIHDDILYIFSSDGYRGRKRRARLAKLNLITGQVKFKKLPVVGKIHWDTIYQPNLLEI